MNFLFGKKQTVSALAQVIEDGRAKSSEELKKIKYNKYEGAEPMLDISVLVLPDNERPFNAQMKSGISKAYLLKPGIRVQVIYDPKRKEQVTLDDDNQAILDRNPQLIKKE